MTCRNGCLAQLWGGEGHGSCFLKITATVFFRFIHLAGIAAFAVKLLKLTNLHVAPFFPPPSALSQLLRSSDREVWGVACGEHAALLKLIPLHLCVSSSCLHGGRGEGLTPFCRLGSPGKVKVCLRPYSRRQPCLGAPGRLVKMLNKFGI